MGDIESAVDIFSDLGFASSVIDLLLDLGSTVALIDFFILDLLESDINNWYDYWDDWFHALSALIFEIEYPA